MKKILHVTLLFFALANTSSALAEDRQCKESPLGKRDLYLRGGFNAWAPREEYQFKYVCNRYELSVNLQGEHKFKVGDEPWSRDADFGIAQQQKTGAAINKLTPIGKELQFTFKGNHKVVLDMSQSVTHPELRIENCANTPFGENVIYLRGGMNHWTANDDYAFVFSCDAYYLNVNVMGKQEFRISDPSWNDAFTLAGPPGTVKPIEYNQAYRLSRIGEGILNNLQFDFQGEHTLRLAFDGGTAGTPSLTIGPKSFENAASKQVSDPLALSARFDSRDSKDKSPFGAVTENTPLRFSFSADPGIQAAMLVLEKRHLEGNQEILEYSPVTKLAMAKQVEDGRERWSASTQFSEIGVYGYYFEIQINNQWFVYQNNRDEIPWTRERGTNGLGLIAEKTSSDKFIRRFRQTVYRADYQVPEWAKDVVYYYIFPERFRNGDKSLDQVPGKYRYHDHTSEKHPQWIDIPYRANTGDGSDVYYNNDFFGGDLIGIIEKLDYIKELGVNTIYMTPIFQAVSNHKYDTADYSKVDPHFGTNQDFERLTAEAKKRGMRVVLDASLNHTGSDSVYFNRFGNFPSGGAFDNAKINKLSMYADWYSFDESKTDVEQQYKGWVGVRDLPELNKASRSFRDFAFGNDDAIMKQWLDRGASGWRMDVAPWVPDDFWREWRPAIKQHKPDVLAVAESYFDSSKFFLGDTFDSTMNYIFRNSVIDFVNGKSAKDTYRNIEYMREVYPQQSFYALMNLLSSHDQPRTLHVFGDHGEKSTAEEKALAKQKYKLALLYQMTFPGSPAVYYGDEVGVTGGEDPYNRAPYPWKDEGGQPDEELLAEFKKLIALRNKHPVLRHGSISAPIYIDEHVIVWLRDDGKTQAVVAVNNSKEAASVPMSNMGLSKTALWRDVLRDQFQKGSISVLNIPARAGIVLLSE